MCAYVVPSDSEYPRKISVRSSAELGCYNRLEGRSDDRCQDMKDAHIRTPAPSVRAVQKTRMGVDEILNFNATASTERACGIPG